jgi:hypothetical protein
MGRPSIRKKGPMTPAERQRRHRRKLRAARREVLTLQKRAENLAKYRKWVASGSRAKGQAAISAASEAREQEWRRLYWQPPLPDANGAADEIARQIAETLMQDQTVTIDDVREAIDRRFGAAMSC